MAGIFTPGLPAPTVANGNAPIPSTGLIIPADANVAAGGAAESVGINTNTGLLAALGNLTAAVLAGTVITCDCSLASYFSITLNATGMTLTLKNVSPGQLVEVLVTQDGTGNRTITTYQINNGANVAVKWPAGTAPTLTTTAAGIDSLAFRFNGTYARGISSLALA